MTALHERASDRATTRSVNLDGLSNELYRRGEATLRQRAAMAHAAVRFCEAEHQSAVDADRARIGVPCCPYCTLYGPGARS